MVEDTKGSACSRTRRPSKVTFARYRHIGDEKPFGMGIRLSPVIEMLQARVVAEARVRDVGIWLALVTATSA